MNFKELWNSQADHQNQWDSLGEDEKVEFVAAQEREECAKIAEKTVCDTHIPTGIKIYGTAAAKAIRARGKA